MTFPLKAKHLESKGTPYSKDDGYSDNEASECDFDDMSSDNLLKTMPVELSTNIKEENVETDQKSEYSGLIAYLRTDPSLKSANTDTGIPCRTDNNVPNDGLAIEENERESASLALKVAETLENSDKLKCNLEPDENGLFVCIFCDKRWKKRHMAKAHIKRHLGIMKTPIHTCELCELRLPKDFISLHNVSHTLLQNSMPECFTLECRDIRNDVAYFIVHDQNKTDTLAKCKHCSEVFSGNNDLRKHFMLHHTLTYMCTICNVRLFEHKLLSQHALLHNSRKYEKSFICRYCKCKYITESALNSHITDQHKRPTFRPHGCTKCNKAYVSEAALQRHIDCHNQLIECPDENCSRLFRNRRDLYSHRRVHEKERYKCLCSTCGTVFMNKQRLQEHIEFEHNGKEPLKCDLCPSEFRCYRNYRRHRKTHTIEANIVCENCGEKFKTGQQLWRHKNTKHMTKKKHVCATCQKEFCKPESLEIHLYNHNHFSDEQPQSKLKIKTCDKCDKKFANSSHLKKHIENRHSEPHTCSYCGKKFVTSYNLFTHMKAHTNTQPKCHQCNLLFRSKVKLDKHIEDVHNDGFSQIPDTSYEMPQQTSSYIDTDGLPTNTSSIESSSTETIQAVRIMEYEPLNETSEPFNGMEL